MRVFFLLGHITSVESCWNITILSIVIEVFCNPIYPGERVFYGSGMIFKIERRIEKKKKDLKFATIGSQCNKGRGSSSKSIILVV